jgi:MoaA/NifB/PqqE/SkfB family radical SAM enzyme
MPFRYYLPALVSNPLVRLKYRWLDKRMPLPASPRHVQIQTVSGCNGRCIFCPNHRTRRQIASGEQMDMALFRSVADQCIDLGVERISPYLMNEPLMDCDLPERIAYITARRNPFQFTKINSNGSLLTEEMAKRLLDSGLNRLNFSVQGLDPQKYQEVMGLSLETVLRNIERFLELRRAGNYKLPRVRVVMLMTRYIEPQLPRIQEYWGARGVKVNINRIENRANHGAVQSESIAVRPLQRFDWCNRMFEQVYVLCDGRMVLCCADWEQAAVMGDCRTQPIAAIWNGSRYEALRRRFLSGTVKGMICDGCSKDPEGDGEE